MNPRPTPMGGNVVSPVETCKYPNCAPAACADTTVGRVRLMNKTPSKNPANTLHTTRIIIRMSTPPWQWILALDDSTCLEPVESLCLPLFTAFVNIRLRHLEAGEPLRSS